MYYSHGFSEILSIDGISFSVIVFVLLLLNSLLIVLFLNSSFFTFILKKLSFLREYDQYSEVFSFYNSKELFKVLLYSALRYLIFTFQFYLLLQMCDVHIDYHILIFFIMAMLFIISVIPTIAITEIGVRLGVAVALIGLLPNVNNVSIGAATLILWIINLLIPSVIGMFFVFTLKFFRKN